MARRIVITCDGCGTDLSDCGEHGRIRLDLSGWEPSDHKRGCCAVAHVHGEYYFCLLACIKNWKPLNAKGGLA